MSEWRLNLLSVSPKSHKLVKEFIYNNEEGGAPEGIFPFVSFGSINYIFITHGEKATEYFEACIRKLGLILGYRGALKGGWQRVCSCSLRTEKDAKSAIKLLSETPFAHLVLAKNSTQAKFARIDHSHDLSSIFSLDGKPCIIWKTEGFYDLCVLIPGKPNFSSENPINQLRQHQFQTHSSALLSFSSVFGDDEPDDFDSIPADIHILASSVPGREQESVNVLSKTISSSTIDPQKTEDQPKAEGASNSSEFCITMGPKDIKTKRSFQVNLAKLSKNLNEELSGNSSSLLSAHTMILTNLSPPPENSGTVSKAAVQQVEWEEPLASPFAVYDLAGGYDWTKEMLRAHKCLEIVRPALQYWYETFGNEEVAKAPDAKKELDIFPPIHVKVVAGDAKSCVYERPSREKNKFSLDIHLSHHTLKNRVWQADLLHELSVGVFRSTLTPLQRFFDPKPEDGKQKASLHLDTDSCIRNIWNHLGEMLGTALGFHLEFHKPNFVEEYVQYIWGTSSLCKHKVIRLIGGLFLYELIQNIEDQHVEKNLIEKLVKDSSFYWFLLIEKARREFFKIAKRNNISLSNEAWGVESWDLNDVLRSVLLGMWPRIERFDFIAKKTFSIAMFFSWLAALELGSFFSKEWMNHRQYDHNDLPVSPRENSSYQTNTPIGSLLHQVSKDFATQSEFGTFDTFNVLLLKNQSVNSLLQKVVSEFFQDEKSKQTCTWIGQSVSTINRFVNNHSSVTKKLLELSISKPSLVEAFRAIPEDKLPEVYDLYKSLAQTEFELSIQTLGPGKTDKVSKIVCGSKLTTFTLMDDQSMFGEFGGEVLASFSIEPSHSDLEPVLCVTEKEPGSTLRFPQLSESYVGVKFDTPPKEYTTTQIIRRLNLECRCLEAATKMLANESVVKGAPISFNITPWLLDQSQNPWFQPFKDEFVVIVKQLCDIIIHKGGTPVAEIMEGPMPAFETPEWVAFWNFFRDVQLYIHEKFPDYNLGIAVDDQFGPGTDIQRLQRITETASSDSFNFSPIIAKIDHLAVRSILRPHAFDWNNGQQINWNEEFSVMGRMALLGTGVKKLDYIVYEGYRGWGNGVPQLKYQESVRESLKEMSTSWKNDIRLILQG